MRQFLLTSHTGYTYRVAAVFALLVFSLFYLFVILFTLSFTSVSVLGLMIISVLLFF